MRRTTWILTWRHVFLKRLSDNLASMLLAELSLLYITPPHVQRGGQSSDDQLVLPLVINIFKPWYNLNSWVIYFLECLDMNDTPHSVLQENILRSLTSCTRADLTRIFTLRRFTSVTSPTRESWDSANWPGEWIYSHKSVCECVFKLINKTCVCTRVESDPTDPNTFGLILLTPLTKPVLDTHTPELRWQQLNHSQF